MRIRSNHQPFSPTSRREQGNIVLTAALIVLALGGAGLALGGLLRAKIDYAADLRLSNYAGTLAQNVAESAVNILLYNWNAGGAGVVPEAGSFNSGTSQVQTGSLLLPPLNSPFSTSYQTGGSALTVKSTASYKVTIAGAGPFAVNVAATVSTDPSAGGTVFPSSAWQTVTRQIDATISLQNNQYEVTGYRR